MDNVIVAHSFTGFICDAKNVIHNTPHVGVCIDTLLNVTIFDTSGTPTTTIKEGTLVTNGSNSVSGFLRAKSKYDTTSQNGQDFDLMTIEACVDATTRSTCMPDVL